MTDQENRNWERAIREALNEPTEGPRRGFARNVVAQIEAKAHRPKWLSSRISFAAVAMLAVIALTIVTLRANAPQATTAADQIRSLAREQRRLESELEDLRQLRQSAAPVVYLAGDETLEFVYALNDPRLLGEPGNQTNGYRTANR